MYRQALHHIHETQPISHKTVSVFRDLGSKPPSFRYRLTINALSQSDRFLEIQLDCRLHANTAYNEKADAFGLTLAKISSWLIFCTCKILKD